MYNSKGSCDLSQPMEEDNLRINDIINKHLGIERPRQMAEAMDDLAQKLEQMDQAEGIFGEVLLEQELDEVTGGIPGITKQPLNTIWIKCQYPGCFNQFKWKLTGTMQKKPPKYCDAHKDSRGWNSTKK